MKRAPKHKRRQSGKRRVDVTRTNRNRITLADGKLKIRYRGALIVSDIPDDIIREIGERSELYTDEDGTMAPERIKRRSDRVIVSCVPEQSRCLRYLAKRYSVTLDEIESGLWQAKRGSLADFVRHCTGHSSLTTFTVWLSEIPEESTGTDAHRRYCLENGLSDMPQRIDYTARRGAPKASYATDGRYSVNELDHRDTRNDNKRAGLNTPAAHTKD